MTNLETQIIQPQISAQVGNYHLAARIGSGSSGQVWRAVDRDGKPVAIKIMNDALLHHEKFPHYFRQFQREIAALDIMEQHPRTPTLHQAQLGTQPPYFVMSLVEGDTLAEDIASGAMVTRPIKGRLQRLFAMAATIDSMHRRGILHRDIKPANIRGWQKPYVLDFGIAIKEGKLSRANPMAGTTLYMPPRPQQPSRFNDYYGLALLAYEVIFCRHALFKPSELDDNLREVAEHKLASGTWYRAAHMSESELPIFLYGVDLHRLDAVFEAQFTHADAFDCARRFVQQLAHIIVTEANAPFVDQVPDLSAISLEHAMTQEQFTEHEVGVQSLDTENPPEEAPPEPLWRKIATWVVGGALVILLIWQMTQF